MRIALIATSKIPSRTANSIRVMKMCQAFVDLGHTIQLWVPGLNPRLPWDKLLHHYGIRDRFAIQWVRDIHLLRRYDFCLRAVFSARRWGADCYYVWPLQAAALASRLGMSTILEVHDLPQGRLGPWLFVQFLRGQGARRLLPITESLRTALEEAFQFSLQTPFVEILPLGVDLDRYAKLPSTVEARKQLGLEEAFTVGYTGHLYPGRGIELLADLAKRNPTIHFLWIGGEESTVVKWRHRLDEAKIRNVKLMGFIPNRELPVLQAACDVLLMPYERQISVSSGGDTARFASPMKVFEYLAVGRAIISSDLPVLKEVLDQDNAVLVPPEDPESWDKALTFLLNHPDRREALALQARRDVGQYAWVERVKRALEGLDAP